VLLTWPLASAAGIEDSPHWNKDACQVCHVSSTPVADAATLNTASADALCASCHARSAGARPCRHVSNIPAGEQQMPDSYAGALDDGRLVCTTCHDLTVQCLAPSRSYSFMNPGFVRDRMSRERGEPCFRCHDGEGFERLNPHAMQAGDPAGPTCTLCHATMPAKDERGWLAVDFNVSRSLNDLCTGCHKVAPHPGNAFTGKPIGWEHLAVPSAGVVDNMRHSEQVLGLIFPLDPINGEVTCATCHNPHPEELGAYPVARTPGSKSRLRADDICQACHDL
jgi:hypothetical protein